MMTSNFIGDITGDGDVKVNDYVIEPVLAGRFVLMFKVRHIILFSIGISRYISS